MNKWDFKSYSKSAKPQEFEDRFNDGIQQVVRVSLLLHCFFALLYICHNFLFVVKYNACFGAITLNVWIFLERVTKARIRIKCVCVLVRQEAFFRINADNHQWSHSVRGTVYTVRAQFMKGYLGKSNRIVQQVWWFLSKEAIVLILFFGNALTDSQDRNGAWLKLHCMSGFYLPTIKAWLGQIQLRTEADSPW